MRQIILDIETTGLKLEQGHRIIEIGCVELYNRRKTGKYYQQYLDPEREIEESAYEIHGLNNKVLDDKPIFADIADKFINFIKNSQLIIHNAPFDTGFINAELKRSDGQWRTIEDYCEILDTLIIAKEAHPGQKNSLDALCKRYGVNNSRRQYHGALLDAQLLADVYLAMTGGQTDLLFKSQTFADMKPTANKSKAIEPSKINLSIIQPDDEELKAHYARLDTIDEVSNGNCLWKNIDKYAPND